MPTTSSHTTEILSFISLLSCFLILILLFLFLVAHTHQKAPKDEAHYYAKKWLPSCSMDASGHHSSTLTFCAAVSQRKGWW